VAGRRDPVVGVPEGRSLMRTFVISDAHGCPDLIQGALDHGGYRPGGDGFVYAGDFLDRSPDAEGCFDLVERYATEVLLGNHELAALLGFAIWPRDPKSRLFRSRLVDKVLNAEPGKRWMAVTCIEGVLVSHAGISKRYQAMFDEECGRDPVLLEACLNAEFLDAVRHELETGEWDRDGILGEDGPLWFRPAPWTRLSPLAGVSQVAGHTPPIAKLEASGFFMVDPCDWSDDDDDRRIRYAVIEDGRVRVVEAPLSPAGLAGCEGAVTL
jgi:hypothetical protein